MVHVHDQSENTIISLHRETTINPHPLHSGYCHTHSRNDGDANRTNKLETGTRGVVYRKPMTLLHFTLPLNCYYGNYFSSIDRVPLVMWHNAVQYTLVHIQSVSKTTPLNPTLQNPS